MTTICLIRHGETDWNKQLLIQGRRNNQLNETGINQAKAVGEVLKHHDANWDLILSSPLDRAYHTACIIKDILQIDKPIIKVDDLIEREFGQAEGCIIEPVIYDKINHDDVIDMEKSSDLQNRAYQTIIKISQMYPNQRILVTTHSHFIKGFFTYISKNYTFFSKFENCGLNYILVEDNNIIGYYDNKKY